MRRNFLSLTLVALTGRFAWAQSSVQSSQKWPIRPVTIIVPFAAGGSTDVLARAVALRLSNGLGQSFVVDNRTGASGNIGAGAAARAAPDGYTLLFTSDNILISPALGEPLSYNVLTDLTPITMLASAPMILFRSSKVRANTVGELIVDIRANPGRYSFSSSGAGGAPHLAGELFRINERLELVHVPYRGAAPALADVASGEVQLTFTTYASARSMIGSQRLIPLAVASKKRTAALPEVPTFAEAGVTPMDIGSAFCMFAPGGTSTDIVQTIFQTLASNGGDNSLSGRVAELGADFILSTPGDFSKQVREEVGRWKEFVPRISRPK